MKTKTTKPWDWGAVLDLATVTRLLGADHVAWVRAQAFPAATAECRARGGWLCNEAETFNAYTSLAAILRGE